MSATGGAIAMCDATARAAPVHRGRRRAASAEEEESVGLGEGEALRSRQRVHVRVPEAGLARGGGRYTFNRLCERSVRRSPHLNPGPEPGIRIIAVSHGSAGRMGATRVCEGSEGMESRQRQIESKEQRRRSLRRAGSPWVGRNRDTGALRASTEPSRAATHQ